jgi:polypeptide N-acetylgalactosaminyltransferase
MFCHFTMNGPLNIIGMLLTTAVIGSILPGTFQQSNGVDSDQNVSGGSANHQHKITQPEESDEFEEDEFDPPKSRTEPSFTETPNAPGEMGSPVRIENPSDEQKDLIAKGYERNAYNEYVSDMISLHRTLPDFRNHW